MPLAHSLIVETDKAFGRMLKLISFDGRFRLRLFVECTALVATSPTLAMMHAPSQQLLTLLTYANDLLAFSRPALSLLIWCVCLSHQLSLWQQQI